MKNKTKKRAGIVAVALMLTVAIGATAGNTLAKYISSATVQSQTATVAQWGYTITANTDNMFGENYGEVANSYAKVSDNNTVVASGESGKNVVAPGTYGYMNVSVNGTSQVNAVLSLTIDTNAFKQVVLSDGADLNYYPINWSVGGVEVVNKDNGAVTTADFAPAIAQVFANAKADVEVAVVGNEVLVFIPANISLSDVDLTIKWEWAFDDGTLTKDSATNETNVKDTLLGYISYGANYDELPNNVVEYLKDTYASAEVEALEGAEKAFADAIDEVKKAEDAVAAAELLVATEIKAVAEAKSALDYLNDYRDQLKEELGEEDSLYLEAKKAAEEAQKVYDSYVAALGEDSDETAKTAYGQLYLANQALASAQETLGAPTEYDEEGEVAKAGTGAYATLENAQNDLYEKVSGAYDDLVLNSKLEVAYGVSMTVEQTQLTAGEFAVKYKENRIAADPTTDDNAD